MAAVLKHLQEKRRREQLFDTGNNAQNENEHGKTTYAEYSSGASHSSSYSSDDSQDSVLTELKPSTHDTCDKLINPETTTNKPMTFQPIHNLDVLESAAQNPAPFEVASQMNYNANELESDSPNFSEISVGSDLYSDPGTALQHDPEFIQKQNYKVDQTIAAVLAMVKDPKASLTYEDARVSTALNPPTKMKIKPVIRHRAPNGTRTHHYCAFCPKIFPSKAQFEKHVRTHTGEKPYSCHFCDATFGRKDRLRMHIRIHTGEKPHQCENCDSKFTTREQLVKHVKVHTGQRDYICGECDKRFAEKSDLKRHVLIHTEQRPFDCKTCGRAFKRKYSLQVHNRLHTGEKPYTCLTCDKAFHTSSHLSSHIQSNHL